MSKKKSKVRVANCSKKHKKERKINDIKAKKSYSGCILLRHGHATVTIASYSKNQDGANVEYYANRINKASMALKKTGD